MSYNTGLLFNKHYYQGIEFDGGDKNRKDKYQEANEKLFRKRNKLVMDAKFDSTLLRPLNSLTTIQQSAFASFDLVTTYPGLMIGTGYAHGSGLQGEFKTGFFFDHTTGLPVIPGSSVKGVLRSMFPGMYLEKAEKCKKEGKRKEGKDEDEIETEIKFWKNKASNRKAFIEGLLADIGIPVSDDPDFVIKLENEIFEGMYGSTADRTDSKCHFSMKDRDIFFDAVITKGDGTLIFNDEFITPHKNPLQNPIPLQLLKIRPNVTFTFQFKLGESYSVDENDISVSRPRLLTADQRLELFRQLLLVLGVGAKTNTGFGQFKQNKKAIAFPQKEVASDAKKDEQATVTNSTQSNEFKHLKKGAKGIAMVVNDPKTPPQHIALQLLVEGSSEVVISYLKFPAGREIGQVAKAEIADIKPNLKLIVHRWL